MTEFTGARAPGAQTRTVLIALFLVPALALAGCLRAPDVLPLTPLSESVEDFAGTFTWRGAEALDATGNATALPEWFTAPGAAPVFMEKLVPGGGAEPNLGITSNGALLVTSFDQVLRSFDHGDTWELAHDLKSPNTPVTEDYFSTADPMLWVDPITDRVFANHMHPAIMCTYMAWSDADGAPGSWTERPMDCAVPVLDHQKIMTAPHGPNASPATVLASTYPTVLYMCVNRPLGMGEVDNYAAGTWCAVSLDGGMSFAYDRQIATPVSGCGHINGHPAPYPDGTVAVALGNLGLNCQRPLTVVVTEDDGLTWTQRQCRPDIGQVEIDADITVTPDGTAYLLFRDRDQLAYLARSADKFVTCDVFRIAPLDHTINAFTAITSGDDGRISMAFLGTRDEQRIDDDETPTPSAATPGTMWHLFITTSFDAAAESPTFVTQQVTPEEDPVQVGCIWYLGGGGGPNRCRNLLDFIDMTRDNEGRVHVAITEGCTPRNGCTGEPFQNDFQSHDMQIAIVVQDRGMSLFEAVGELAPLGFSWPMPLER